MYIAIKIPFHIFLPSREHVRFSQFIYSFMLLERKNQAYCLSFQFYMFAHIRALSGFNNNPNNCRFKYSIKMAKEIFHLFFISSFNLSASKVMKTLKMLNRDKDFFYFCVFFRWENNFMVEFAFITGINRLECFLTFLINWGYAE